MHVLILTGAALVGLPVLLHLIMRQEPKHILLPTFRFLKQKRRINQRKLRLRHLLLMLMRMLLIVLMCAALFQPTLISEGFSLRSEQPVAAVMVIDTSPSMGYVLGERTGLSEARLRGLKLLEESPQGPWTALDDARARALEILEELPANSKVAVVDTSDRNAGWALSVNDARVQIRNIKKTRAANAPVTRALEQAYNLFPKVDQLLETGQDPLPRMLLIFSDRTNSSWDPGRNEALQELQKRVPPPSIFTAYVDVGVDKPVNTAITNVELNPEVIPVGKTVKLQVTVEGTTAQKNAVVCHIPGQKEIKKPVNIEPGKQAITEFQIDGLKPGVHQAEISLVAGDGYPGDNVRYVTFQVREPRKVLAIAEVPERPFSAVVGGLGERVKVIETAVYWQIALRSHLRYASDIVSTAEVTNKKWKAEDFAPYELVALASVPAPDEDLWEKLYDYVNAGGQLVILPAEDMRGYASEIAKKLMPGRFDKLVERGPKEESIKWAWDAVSYQHPLMSPFREWRENPKYDFVHFEPTVRRYWKLSDWKKENVVVSYADANDADQRTPAILEKRIGDRGRVVVLTTSWEYFSDKSGKSWNNYLASSSSFFLVFTNQLVSYLIGDIKDATFNFQNGQNVIVKWPAENTKKAYYLEGPDVIGDESILKREEGQAYLRLGPDRMQSPGNFRVSAEDRKWSEGFSLNAPASESNLERIGADQIEPLLGKDSVAPATKDLKVRDVLKGKFTQPIELFPFLMVLLLLFLALENLLANKFYKQPPPQPQASG